MLRAALITDILEMPADFCLEHGLSLPRTLHRVLRRLYECLGAREVLRLGPLFSGTHICSERNVSGKMSTIIS